MAKKIDLIGRKKYRYNDDIIINIPTIGQIRGGDNEETENQFWKEVNLFIKTPTDMISELDSLGMDFENVSEYMLFFMLLTSYIADKNNGCQLFEGLDYRKLKAGADSSGQLIFVDETGKEIFNEIVYLNVANIIATMIGAERTPKKKFGNAFAKKMRIQQDYRKKEKARKEKDDSDNVLGSIILRLCNNCNFPYNFETVNDVTIYNLFQSVKQIDKDISVDEIMDSRLVGADLNKLPPKALSRYV